MTRSVEGDSDAFGETLGELRSKGSVRVKSKEPRKGLGDQRRPGTGWNDSGGEFGLHPGIRPMRCCIVDNYGMSSAGLAGLGLAI